MRLEDECTHTFNLQHLMDMCDKGLYPKLSDICEKVTFNHWAFVGGTDTYEIRRRHQIQYGFSIVTQELIDELYTYCKGQKIIEVGAGSGWLARGMRMKDHALDYTTLDAQQEGWGWVGEKGVTHSPIDHQCKYDEIDYSPFNVIISSWPNYDCPEIDHVVKSLKTGDLFILCSEGEGGCVGSDSLFELLDEHYKFCNYLETDISFPGIRDYWTVYRKK